LNLLVAVQQNIQIQRARRVAIRARAGFIRFELMQVIEQILRA
jgi:hypothetical protein